MSPARNPAPLMDLADLDLGDLLPPEMQQPRRIASGVFTRPSLPQPRPCFMPGPVGTRMPSQPPAPTQPRKASAFVSVLFGGGGFLLATTIATYLLCR